MPDSNNTPFSLHDAYNLSTPDDSREYYAKIASNYEKSFIHEFGYIFPSEVAHVAVKHLPTDRAFSVIDIGCGTGVLGQEIAHLRSNAVIDGADISTAMLEIASTKIRADGSVVYTDVHEADLTDTIYFATNYYDMLVSVGAFTMGHLGPYDLLDLFSVCRSGATVVVGVNAQHFDEQDFDTALQEAAQNKLITKPVSELVQIYAESSKQHGDQGRIVVFKKN